ncbi:cell division protein FtsZ [Salinimicrobium sp. GXAS 041]|uniref:cell division protein FtsZ n=1 Tax=Salinimicrobium sp. GXAS 041 TaxID=3400806 RepID=UPI003C73CCC5
MSSTEFENISFDLPKNQSNVIKVIGVGGGGSNAINHMFQQGIKGVDFVICNTDAQALENSSVPNKIQLGVSLTEGLGAGANPQVGEQAAVESFDDIKGMLDTNTKMVFITAGMGGGTGTGAAPIIAKQAKEMDILTVGIVTIPFQFEGKMRNEQAQLGVENLRSHVDSLIVINNNKLREVYGNLGFKAGFSKADEVLATASRGIAEVITHHYTQNIDLRDAKTVLSNSGTAIMGSAQASGATRANDAIAKALDSPLLNDNKITGAKNVLLLIVSGSEEITIDEIGEINDHIQAEAGHSANIIMGVGEDESLDEAISVTIIATGFDIEQQNEIVNTETKKIIHTLEDEQRAEQNLNPKKTSSYEAIPPKEDKIVHTLSLEEEETEEPDDRNPSAEVRNMDVIFEEVKPTEALKPAPIEDFIITDAVKEIEVNEPEEVKQASQEAKEQEQFMFSFDMPKKVEKPAVSENREVKQENIQNNNDASEEESKIVHHLSEEENEAKRSSQKREISPEVGQNGVKRYSLEDYMEVEQMMKNSEPTSRPIQEKPQHSQQSQQPAPEQKAQQEAPSIPAKEEEVDPFNSPISEDLVKRAAERRAKMKEFNYKFRNNVTKIEDIEKQPAYKRAGIELNSANPGEERMSRTSISSDDNNELHFRSNNSFLHDNVD